MQRYLRLWVLALATLPIVPIVTMGQTTPTDVSVSLVLTLKGSRGADLSGINSENLIVNRGSERAKIADVLRLQNERGGLELFLMMDDTQDISYGTQIEDVRNFILAQPPTTKIGVAYMDIEGPKIAQGLTNDHSLAAQAVKIPLGRLANGQSPYTSLSKLIDGWPASNDRREVVMISSGEDATFAGGSENPYRDAVISKAQRAGIVVFTISTSPQTVLQAENDAPTMSPGQNSLTNIESRRAGAIGKFSLAEIAEATGGEFYYYRSSAALSFAPYLTDISNRLTSQYLVSFLARPGKKPTLQSVKVRTTLPHITVATAGKVYVP